MSKQYLAHRPGKGVVRCETEDAMAGETSEQASERRARGCITMADILRRPKKPGAAADDGPGQAVVMRKGKDGLHHPTLVNKEPIEPRERPYSVRPE